MAELSELEQRLLDRLADLSTDHVKVRRSYARGIAVLAAIGGIALSLAGWVARQALTDLSAVRTAVAENVGVLKLMNWRLEQLESYHRNQSSSPPSSSSHSAQLPSSTSLKYSSE